MLNGFIINMIKRQGITTEQKAKNSISQLKSIYDKLVINKNLYLKNTERRDRLTKSFDEYNRKKDFHDIILKRWSDEGSEYEKCSFSTPEILNHYTNRINEEKAILSTIAQEIENINDQFKIETAHQDVLDENLANLYDELNMTIDVLDHLTQPEHHKLKEAINEHCKKITDLDIIPQNHIGNNNNA